VPSTRLPTPAPVDVTAAMQLIAATSDVAVLADAHGVVQQVAITAPEYAIEASESWVGRPFTELVTIESRAKTEALLREVQAKGSARRRQVNHPTPTGEDVPVGYTATRLGDAILLAGRDLRPVSSLQQRLVEAQQAMERDYWRLRHVETRYRLLFQLSGEAILVVDAGTLRVVDANAAAGTLFGEPTEKLIGRAFPFGVADAGAEQALGGLVATARATGRGTDVRVHLQGADTPVVMSASCFRQDTATLLLVRVVPEQGAGVARRSPLLGLIEHAPDAVVVTDLEGRVTYANQAFLDLTQVASEDQVRGELLSTWVGRPGADVGVFLAMLRKHGAVRLVATTARGLHGLTTEVEVSSAWQPEGLEPAVVFLLRDVGRRLAHGPSGARDLTRAVEQLTGLIGRTSLRELVRDTVDLVERHFIEAALELTGDNRTSAAEVLGVSRQSLYVKLRRHNLGGITPDRDDDVEAAD
jgi:transcriptional regulator PpsR